MSKQSKNMKLNIGLLLDDTLDKPDGVQQYVMTVGEYLRSQGHEVHYLVAETRRNDLQNIHSLTTFVSVKFNGNSVRTPLPASKKKIVELVEKLDLDVLHVQMPFSPFFAAKIIRAVSDKCRVVGTWHTFPSTRMHFLSNVALSLLIRRSLKRFSVTMGVSKATADFADRAYGTNSIVVPNAVELDRFHVSRKHKQSLIRRVVFLGRFVERKGPVHLIAALQEVKKRGFDMNRLEIIMGGSGPLLGYCEQLSSKMGLHVSFPGFIKEQDKANLLASADVTVFPSTGGEAFGISLVEAMATGQSVVIGGNNAGYRSVLEGHSDQLVDPKYVQEFADILLRYLAIHGEDRRAIIDSQLRHIQQYDASIVCAKLLDVYTS